MTVVLDASALVELLTGSDAATVVKDAIASGGAIAPELIDAEVLYALGGLERSGRLTQLGAERAVSKLARAPITRVSHRRLLVAAWRRRHTLSTYDALYVALAATRGCPLVTADARLAAAPGLDIAITLVPAG